MFRNYPTAERRDTVFENMMKRRRSWERAFQIRRTEVKHWIIHVPGWGTVYGRGTREQAEEVTRLREKPNRGVPQIQEAEKPDQRIEWRDLPAILVELRK